MAGPLRVTRSVVVPERELRWRFSRSSGPGGQSVNTADSRVELSLDLTTTTALGPTLRARALERLAGRLALHNDLRRSRLAHGAYGLVTRPLAGSSFLHDDGLLSIRRSYRPAELAGVRPGWSARALGPFRLLLEHDVQVHA